MAKETLNTYSFTDEDINTITYALRRFSKDTLFPDLAKSAKELIEYIEKEKAAQEAINKATN